MRKNEKSEVGRLSIKQKMMKEKDNGITLVALVITVIIIIILATITLNFTFGEDGIITKANQAKYMAELSTFQEELGLFKANKQISEEGFSAESITAGEGNLSYVTDDGVVTEGTIYDVITSLRGSSFAGKMEIIKGELLINSQDMEEIRVAQSMGIQVNPYIIVDGELKSDGANLALMDSSGTLTIPDGVTKIGNGAFANLSGLKTIIIPGTVKEIGQNAFSNNADLERVVLQDGVEIIGECAFKQCEKLIYIELPESLREIRRAAFYICRSLNTIKIPSNVKELNGSIFSDCTNLSQVQLSENLEQIGAAVFYNCYNLEKIYIPKNVNYIANSAFTNCTSLKDIEISAENKEYKFDKESGMLITSNGNNIIFISGEILNNITTFSIPEGIVDFNVSIGRYNNITSLIFPNSLETIGSAANFPTTIKNIQISAENNNFIIENECLYNSEETELIMCFTKESTANIADSIITVKNSAFRQATNIENVILPDSVTSIEEYIFSSVNNKLKNVTLGKNLTYIDPLFKYSNYYGNVTIDELNQNYAIENNELYNKDKSELISVLYEIEGKYIVNNSVKKLGNEAFIRQSKMTELIIQEGLKEIGDNIVRNCSNLIMIYLPNSIEKIEENAFLDAANLNEVQIDKEPNSIAGAPWGAVKGERVIEWLRK